jgi:hypothetical protein
MRIIVKPPPGYVPEHEREPSSDSPLINGVVPSWMDVEVQTDAGELITEVKSITLHISDDEPDEPIVATLEVYVSELDITCERADK